jgi:hypothetical protein
MDLGPYYATLAASDRLRVLVEELRRRGPTREILRELGCLLTATHQEGQWKVMIAMERFG